MTTPHLDTTTSDRYAIREQCLMRDVRAVAWTDTGPLAGEPVLRFHGTPGSRWSLVGSREVWGARNLRMITPERPGYGASTAFPGWQLADHADDVAAILDELGLDRVHVLAHSGGAPHALAFAADHPDRVHAAAIAVGAAPFSDDDIEHLLPENQVTLSFVRTGDLDGLRARTAENRARFLADPEAWMRGLMASAPESDRRLMEVPDWSEWFFRGAIEAVRASADGWVDDAWAVFSPWELDLSKVHAHVTWWHGADDRNVPIAAAERLVAQLPNARLQLFPPGSGHFAPFQHEGEILDGLLSPVDVPALEAGA